MATINWSIGDFFAHVDPVTGIKSYGIVTSPEAECILVKDSGLRTGRYTIVSTFIPNSAVPSGITDANFEVKMALFAAFVAIGKCNSARVM